MTLVGVVANDAELRAAAAVEVQLYPLSGEVRLFNPNAADFGFVYYELTSTANAFTGAPAAWTSIADNFDASGNGFIDPVNDWLKLSGTSSKVAEGLFVGSGSRLPAMRSIGLGSFWDPQAVKPNDVASLIVDASLVSAPAAVVVSLVGDYNHDLVVDAMDYSVWRNAFGSVTSPSADGNFDGIVDASDYTVWRDHFGESLIGAGFGALAGSSGGGSIFASVVPEPGSVLLTLLAGWGLFASGVWCRKRESI